MKSRRRSTRRGIGIWCALAVALVFSVFLVASLAHRRGSVTLNALGRSTVERHLEEIALSAANEAAHDILNHRANDPTAAGGWFEALRPPFGVPGRKEEFDVVATAALAGTEPFAGLGLQVQSVTATLEALSSNEDGLAQGRLAIVVAAESPALARPRAIRVLYRFYLTGNCNGTRNESSHVRLGRACLVSIRG